jgi:hypothetical protein
MIESLELGFFLGADISAVVAWTAFAATVALLSLLAARAGLFVAADEPAHAVRIVAAPDIPAPAPRDLDLSSQVERLFAVISDCQRLAVQASTRHATARAELDRADYHMSALLIENPMLQEICGRVRPSAPAELRRAPAARPAFRLAA